MIVGITSCCPFVVGCGSLSSNGSLPGPPLGPYGTIHGGQQPISGAMVDLIAAGTTGYGSAGTVLGSAITDSDGSFTFGTLLSCPAGDPLTYLQSSGGNPGNGSNPNAAEAAVVGVCSSLSSSKFINASEVTTVATAFALSQFASLSSAGTSIGTSATNLRGLKNAGSSFSLLADTNTGFARLSGSIPGAIVPTAELNTLADILASCVNSGGNLSESCGWLFSAATPPGGLPPTDTFQAAIDIALNPGNNAAVLSDLLSPSSPFQPTLPNTPTDFSIGIVYSGGAFTSADAVHGVDVDGSGNVWAVAAGSGINGKSSGIVEISPSGEYLSPPAGFLSNGLVDPQTLAINSAGNIEVASRGNNEIFEISPSGAAGAFSVSTAASLGGPVGIAIDNRDLSSWITDTLTNQVTHIDANGVEISTSSPLPAGSAPLGVAIDGFDNVWIASSDQNSLTGSNSALRRLSPSGSPQIFNGPVHPLGTGIYPFDVAIDNAGNIWLAQYSGLGEYQTFGAMLSPLNGYPSNPDNSPLSLAIDGAGRCLAANSNLNFYNAPGTVTVFANDGTLLSTANNNHGYSANGVLPINLFGPRGVALDASGNMWVGGKSGSAAILVELIGIAAPVMTPLSAANYPNMLGIRP